MYDVHNLLWIIAGLLIGRELAKIVMSLINKNR